MVVPAGFRVELVAAEPDIVNPVAICVDEKGRYWITESFEYPRAEAGPGRDRIKVLEDTNRDGTVDQVTLFAEGLNIPSGIAVGNGGVWVANAPDLLFLEDTDGDLKADQTRVILTGFGRTDTHELPSALTWGPDGWLYGLNGVFNHSHVKYGPDHPQFRESQPGWQFTCALWRIHPRTGEFQLFSQGTSNPWGVAINDEGDFFVSACVIDHLWHLAESAYYIRQGGPYPPHTWPLPSIVQHTHQKAAYCGITWFDTDGYPDLCRRVLVMGNIHGGCLNVDRIERHQSTYRGFPHPGFPAPAEAWKDDTFGVIRKTDQTPPQLADFLSANDAWFMPVAQLTGADGHLYVLDWYDRYHCYQDAMADAPGIDRGRGRLYRVRWEQAPSIPVRDLSSMTDAELMALALHGPSEYHRHTARRVLGARLAVPNADASTLTTLRRIVRDEHAAALDRLRAAWILGSGNQLDLPSIQSLQSHHPVDPLNPTLDAWSIRWLGERTDADIAQAIKTWVTELHKDSTDSTQSRSGDRVTLQIAIALGRLAQRTPATDRETRQRFLTELLKVGGGAHDDPVIPAVVWQNSAPLVLADPATGFAVLQTFSHAASDDQRASRVRELYTSRMLSALFDAPHTDGALYAKILRSSLTNTMISDEDRHRQIQTLTNRVVTGSFSKKDQQTLRTIVADSTSSQSNPALPMAHLLVALGDAKMVPPIQQVALDTRQDNSERLFAFQVLVAGGQSKVAREIALRALEKSQNDAEQIDFCRDTLLAWAGDPSDSVATDLLERLPSLPTLLRPTVVEVLTQRAPWSLQLLRAVQAGKIDKHELNYHQIQRLAASNQLDLRTLSQQIYGQIRQGTRADRQRAIDQVRTQVTTIPGDPLRGQFIFQRTCATCHKIYGQGAEVGPDITRNGRNNWDQLLQNMLDPSLVIGPGYQARILVTQDGRSLTGIPLEESDTRVVLKIPGGKTETFPRSEIDVYQSSEVSLMPEGLENQLTAQELADLLQFLALTERPDEEDAKWIPGTPDFPSRTP